MPRSRLKKLRTSQDEPPVWQKWNRRLILIILLCLAGITWKFFTPALQDLREQEAIKEGLEGQLRRETQVKARLSEEVGWLLDANDTRYLESIARDRLDLQGEGEKILNIEPQPEPGSVTGEEPQIIFAEPPAQDPSPSTPSSPAPFTPASEP